MTFAYPWVLLLISLPLGLLIRHFRTGGFRLVIPVDHSRTSPGKGISFLVQTATALPYVLLFIVIGILAGPQKLSDPVTRRKLTNIQLCLDVSGSMAATFGGGDRYDAAMDAILEFINYREGDAFGLTFFGGHYLHWVPLTEDTSAFECARDFLGPRNLPQWFSGGTMIGMALRQCRKVINERPEGDRMVILLSDGYSADLSGGTAENIAADFKKDDITVHTIHIGTGSPPADLYTITSQTGGEVFSAGDPQALEQVFRTIDEMQVTEMEKVSAETIDNFYPWAVAGGGVLACYLLTLFGLRWSPW